MDASDTLGRHNGWTFDPSREVWWAKAGPSTWTEVRGTLEQPPAWAPRKV